MQTSPSKAYLFHHQEIKFGSISNFFIGFGGGRSGLIGARALRLLGGSISSLTRGICSGLDSIAHGNEKGGPSHVEK